MKPSLLCFLMILLFSATGPTRADETPAIDFVTQIKPLLEKHCHQCHGPKKQASGLRLDVGHFLLQGGDRGKTVIPGKADQSVLFQALTGKGEVEPMPAEKPRLAKKQIDLFRLWINQGARMPKSESQPAKATQDDHWAFQPIRQPRVPTARLTDWVRNPIDFFILRRLQAERLSPSPEADRVTLIRRLSFDLRGLPPSVDEVEAFIADREPGAYERLVDRFLASPRYGERWGRHWLDLARYADSNGFTIDSARLIWKYRDWVIDALNADKPFDEFTIEQFAGDLLPTSTREQLIATGFHRNTLINQEGGTDKEQFRVEAVVDRVNTTGAVYLGLTIGCAQCHEHKFDPISQRDFYRLYAFFNSCEDINSTTPTLSLGTPQQDLQLKQYKKGIAESTRVLHALDKRLNQLFAAWEKRFNTTQKSGWKVLDPVEFRSQGGANMTKLEDHSILVDGTIPANDGYTILVNVASSEVTAVKLETLIHEGLPNKGPGLAANGNFTLSGFELAAAPRLPPSNKEEGNTSETGNPAPTDFRPVRIRTATADYSQKHGAVANAIDGKLDTFWGVHGTKERVDHEAIFVFARRLKNKHGWQLKITLRHRTKYAKYSIGRFRISTTAADETVVETPTKIQAILAISEQKRSALQKRELQTHFQNQDPSRIKLSAALDRLKKEQAALNKVIPTTMILRELSKPRQTRIQIRGDFLRRGAKVQPGVPAILPPISNGVENNNRLDLARWLVSSENPLTARVTVNRYWQRFFGLGLIETENDFGTQGTPPTHPDLLDWLAAEFMRQNWSVKSIHRLIVTSAVYRQSSRLSRTQQNRDPQNRLYARQTRIRLEAEGIRDACLTVSSLLSDKLKGPSVYPPQPQGIDVLTQNKKNWGKNEDKGEDRFRRGMYTFFWRSSPYPFLMTFDSPQANISCTRRARSNTPLQALTLANDQAFFEMAQALALRILQLGPNYDEGRLRFAFQTCLSRDAQANEMAALMKFLEKQRSYFQTNKAEADKVAPTNRAKQVSAADAAAWTAVARALMNLDEFITRE